MTDLVIGCDLGSSLSKFLCKLQSLEKIHVLAMEPELIRLPIDSITTHESVGMFMSQADSEHQAWVQCCHDFDNGVAYAVGLMARHFKAVARLDTLKYESALYKVLAAVGVIASKYKLRASFSVAMSVLLPYGEYVNREQLHSQLSQQLHEFYFRGKRYRVKLKQFDCLPEGGGLSMMHLRHKGWEWFQQGLVMTLMMGHRNSSMLLFERGKISSGETTDLGFYQLVDKVIERTPGQNRNSLTKSIYKIGHQINKDNKTLCYLVKSERSQNVSAEIEQLVRGISTARQEYWFLLKDWLDSVDPDQLQGVIIGGGGARYLEQELQKHYFWTEICWGKEDAKLVSQNLIFPSYETDGDIYTLSYRFLDVYGHFIFFSKRFWQNN